MSTKRALSLLIVSLGLATAGNSSADSYREGYICSLVDYGTIQGFSITSQAYCGGFWSGWLWLPTSASVYPGQFDRLQQWQSLQRHLYFGFDSAGTPNMFVYN